MATFSDIGLSQPAASTITMKLRSVTQDVNSTVVHQEVLTLGDAESTLGLARVLATTPASTAFGLVIRQGREPSTYYNSTGSTVTSTASSAFYEMVAAVGGARICVYALNVTSTLGLVGEFMTSTVGPIWNVDLGAGPSGGAIAVTPPARLFHTVSGAALNVRLGTTGAQVRYALSWFAEP